MTGQICPSLLRRSDIMTKAARRSYWARAQMKDMGRRPGLPLAAGVRPEQE
jgi:hypothetical protein